MSRDYYHARWNNENWKDDGHCLRYRHSIKMGDIDIGTAHISYSPYNMYGKTAHGTIDFHDRKQFGRYTFDVDSGHSLRQFHGPKCVPKMQEYIENFIKNNHAQICRWYHDELYYTMQRDNDKERKHYRITPTDEEFKEVWDYVMSVEKLVVEVEKVC